jgi:hypothetical protein
MVIEEREFVVDIDAFHLSNVGNIEVLNNNTPPRESGGAMGRWG